MLRKRGGSIIEYKEFSAAWTEEDTPHTEYLGSELAAWHWAWLEKRCEIMVTALGAQELVDKVCDAENIVRLRVELKPGRFRAGLLYHDGESMVMGLGHKWSPAYVVVHELGHYLENIWYGQKVLDRLRTMGKWEDYHSEEWKTCIQHLVWTYPWLLTGKI